MVVLFKLDHILRYKSKPKHDYEMRWAQFDKYARHLQELKPKIKFPRGTFTKTKGIKGKALKEYEDKLDAIFCAYIAFYCWYKPEKCSVLGNMKDGYILTPVHRKIFIQQTLK
jgi:predicted RNase H-like nuclease